MELLERQQRQERSKSGPKVNTPAVKHSSLWIPSEIHEIRMTTHKE